MDNPRSIKIAMHERYMWPEAENKVWLVYEKKLWYSARVANAGPAGHYWPSKTL